MYSRRNACGATQSDPKRPHIRAPLWPVGLRLEPNRYPRDRERPVHTGSGPIALRDGGRCGGQNSSFVVDELGRIEGIVVVIAGVRADVERLLMLLQLVELLDDLAPHLLRDNGIDRVADLAPLDLHHQ